MCPPFLRHVHTAVCHLSQPVLGTGHRDERYEPTSCSAGAQLERAGSKEKVTMESEECCGRGCGAAPGTGVARLPHRFLYEFGEGAVREGFPREIVSRCGRYWVCSLVFWSSFLPGGMHFPSPLKFGVTPGQELEEPVWAPPHQAPLATARGYGWSISWGHRRS